jgi:hypothetical protein
MQALIGGASLVAAAVAHAVGWGPLFSATPLLGVLRVLAGTGLAIGGWLRLRRAPAAARRTAS